MLIENYSGISLSLLKISDKKIKIKTGGISYEKGTNINFC
jgi:hypothetical protein